MIIQDIQNKKERYISCDLIEHGLDFFADSINFCCRIPPSEKGYKKIIDDYHGSLIDYEKFFEIKRYYRNEMKKGNIISECEGCIYLREDEWDNGDYISFINFNSWINCNEHCIYCPLNDNKAEDKRVQYNVYPAVKDMAEKGYLKKGGDITIAGGEPCSAPEFENLIKLFSDYDMRNIRVLTNASKYSPSLAAAIKEGRANIDVSVDSGTRETFKKIKRRDFYDIVWENIRKYASLQPAPDRVKAKYILIPEINDNKKEISAWLEKSLQTGLGRVSFDIEMMWYEKNKNNMPEYIIELLNYAVNSAAERRLDIDLLDRARILAAV